MQPAPGQRPPAASPSNILDKEIVNEPQPLNPAQVGEAGRMTPQEAAELAKVLVPPVDLQSDTEGYGYPKGSRVYKINMQQAWVLALMNARFYQFNLETRVPGRVAGDPAAIYVRAAVLRGPEPVTAVPQTQGAGAGSGLPVDAGRRHRPTRSPMRRDSRRTVRFPP